MAGLSIFNDVLGPIMIGPSSSHTAGPNRIGRMAGALLGERPVRARISFDPLGSLAYCYRPQGSDRGFAAGLLGMAADDPAGADALRGARGQLDLEFHTAHLDGGEHPNTAQLELWGESGRTLRLWGVSAGGGMIIVSRVGDYTVQLAGDAWELFVEVPPVLAPFRAGQLADRLAAAGVRVWSSHTANSGNGALINLKLDGPPPEGLLPEVNGETAWVGLAPPVLPVQARPDALPLFDSAAELVARAESQGWSMGEAGLQFELNRSGWERAEAEAYMERVRAVMSAAAQRGLAEDLELTGGLVRPSARRMEAARKSGRMLAGGPVSRGITLAMAVMEVNNAMGVVCAAPTAGSCGVVPGAVLAAAEHMGADTAAVNRALFAAGAIGLVIARRATFAAELAGCQAECGAASAMAAAALVELAGGAAREAEEAASVALQNTLGMICDPVASLVQVPCFGKNSLGVANAFAAADMVLGGYRALIPFDEVADAMLRVGQTMDRELRCTALGGLAATPTGQRLAQQQRLVRLEDWT